MIFRVIIAFTTLFLSLSFEGSAQESKKPIYDINGKPLLCNMLTEGDIYYADCYTKQGDTLKAIPYVNEYVECNIGRDSLKESMKGIYYDTYNQHNEYYYHNLRIFVYLLFDQELTIKEIRFFTRCKEDDKFVLDICNKYTELFESLKWTKAEGFPELAPYSFTVVSFFNSLQYLHGDTSPY